MILFGISNCDTVRKARKFLENQPIEFTFHDFRKDGLQSSDIENWLAFVSFDDIVNKRSTSWRALEETQKTLLSAQTPTTEALNLLCANPTLIKRPVLQGQDKVLLGFKEADYQQCIEKSIG